MRCKIDGGMLEHIEQIGYSDRWKCRRCKVEWTMEPVGAVDTDESIITHLLKEKLREYEQLKEQIG